MKRFWARLLADLSLRQIVSLVLFIGLAWVVQFIIDAVRGR